MTFAEYCRKVNAVLERMAAENRHSRTYIRLLRPYGEKKLNIIGSFEEALALEAGAAMAFNVHARKSFGMVPAETFEGIRAMTLGPDSPFASAVRFGEHVETHWRNFCVDPDEFGQCFSHAVRHRWIDAGWFSPGSPEPLREAFCKALYARCLLQASRASGFWMKVAGNAPDDSAVLEAILENDPMAATGGEKDKGLFRVCGRLRDTTLRELDERFAFSVVTPPGHATTIEVSNRTRKGGMPFSSLYGKENAGAYTFSGSAIYSGVLPRLCRLEYMEPQMGNEEMQQMKLSLGRTTFMTMHGLNNPGILAHPFMDTVCGIPAGARGETVSLTFRELNRLFDRMEVCAQEEYRENLENRAPGLSWRQETEEEFRICNAYLSHSLNVHNINISGNLITSDRYCIYARRNRGMLDGGNLYCSVNGGCEVFDPGVDFYTSSVPEDLPAIRYGPGPVYFGGELTREAIAELGVGDNSVFWNYYGLSLMGNKAGKRERRGQTVWFHFNVLGERQCLDTLDSIFESKKQAAENFESSELFGYRLMVFDAFHKLVGWLSMAAIQKVLENVDLLAFLVLAYAIHRGQARLDLDNTLVGVVGILALVFVVCKGIAFFNSLKARRTVLSWQNRDRIRFEQLLRSPLLGRARKKDPVFLALTALRFMRVFRT